MRCEYPFQFFVEERWYNNSFAFYGASSFNDRKQVILPVTLKSRERGTQQEPFLDLGRDEAQQLFESLWKAGFRPKDGTGNGGHIEAIKYHLEDMRRLVFDRHEKRLSGSAEIKMGPFIKEN